MPRLTFILTLIDGIIEKFHSSATATSGRPSREQNPIRLTERHFPEFILSTLSNAESTSVAMFAFLIVLGSKPIICLENVTNLCAAPCFQIYHTIKSLSSFEILCD